MPASRPGLDDQPVVVAEAPAQPLVDVAEADAGVAGGASLRAEGKGPPELGGVHAHAVVLDADHGVVAGVLGGDGHVPEPVLALEAVPHRVLDQRLQAQERHGHRQHLGRDPQRDAEPVAEAGPLEHR